MASQFVDVGEALVADGAIPWWSDAFMYCPVGPNDQIFNQKYLVSF